MVAGVVSCPRFRCLITLAHTNWHHYSSLSTLATSDLLDGLVSSPANVPLGLIPLRLLGLHLLGFAFLDLHSGGFVGPISFLASLVLLSADLFDGHTNEPSGCGWFYESASSE